MPLAVKLDGQFVIVEGECPVCDWRHPHAHERDFFHESVETLQAKRHSTVATVTNPSPAAPKTTSTAPKSLTATSTPTVSTPVKSTPVEKTNLYRIRTVGGGLSLDRTVMGDKKKNAISKAIERHTKIIGEAAGGPGAQVSFCRYIGKVRKYEPKQYGSYVSGWGMSDYEVW